MGDEKRIFVPNSATTAIAAHGLDIRVDLLVCRDWPNHPVAFEIEFGCFGYW